VIRSMTGFGAAVMTDADVSVRVEARSVNHRYLQVKSRLPPDHGHLEIEVEALVKSHLERGAVTISVSLERAGGRAPAKIDVAVARRYQGEIAELGAKLGLSSTVSLETLLGLPGVISTGEDDTQREHESKLVLKCLRSAIEALVVMREREGKALLADLQKNAAGVESVMAKLELRMPKVLAEYHENLKNRVDDLLGVKDATKAPSKAASGRAGAIDPADLAREIALVADKMDVSEEFARLQSHLSQLEQLLGGTKPVGRQLDFLVQEFFREANTIGSKCNDAEAAHAVVELKTLIERLREQVQNVE
jgi:uncharacterized protein (TIGR00255 family)